MQCQCIMTCEKCHDTTQLTLGTSDETSRLCTCCSLKIFVRWCTSCSISKDARESMYIGRVSQVWIKKISTLTLKFNFTKCTTMLECLLPMVYLYGMTHIISHVENITKTMWLSIYYMLFSRDILDYMHRFSFGQ